MIHQVWRPDRAERHSANKRFLLNCLTRLRLSTNLASLSLSFTCSPVGPANRFLPLNLLPLFYDPALPSCCTLAPRNSTRFELQTFQSAARSQKNARSVIECPQAVASGRRSCGSEQAIQVRDFWIYFERETPISHELH